MPLLGMGGQTEKGIALPILPWWNAIAINDVPAQSDFYSTANGRFLNDLVRDAQDGEKVALLYKVWRQRLSYRVVRTAEESKIALSDRAEHAVSCRLSVTNWPPLFRRTGWRRRLPSRYSAFWNRCSSRWRTAKRSRT